MTNTEFRRIQKDARFADKTGNASYLLGTSVGQFCSHFCAPHSSSLNVWQMWENKRETGEFQREIFSHSLLGLDNHFIVHCTYQHKYAIFERDG